MAPNISAPPPRDAPSKHILTKQDSVIALLNLLNARLLKSIIKYPRLSLLLYKTQS